MGQESSWIGKNKTGAALPIVLLVIVVLTLIGIAAINIVTTDINIAANDRAAKQAFYLAEAGIEKALAGINNPILGYKIDATTIQEDDSDTNITLAGSQATGTYNVTIARIASDLLRITSTGTTTNGRGSKTIVTVVRETEDIPEIYNFALFSAANITIGGNADVYDGDVYSGGNIRIGNSPAVTNGDVLACGNIDFQGGSSIQDGSFRANGNINLGSQNAERTNQDAIAAGIVDDSGSATVGGEILEGVSPDPVNAVSHYEEYHLQPNEINDYRNNAGYTFPGGTPVSDVMSSLPEDFSGTIFINGDFEIHGQYSGDVTFVVDGNLNVSGNFENTSPDGNFAFIVTGNVDTQGMEQGGQTEGFEGIIYCEGRFDARGNTAVTGSVIAWQGITISGSLTVNYVTPATWNRLPNAGEPTYTYRTVSWQG